MTIIDYITEEVQRQGHDTTVSDGLIRVAWMLEAWVFSLDQRPGRPTYRDVVQLGKLVEQVKNQNGLRSCGVRVGDRICPPAGEVPYLLERLFENGGDLAPIDFYREFELIHPFVDGNGRTGKILLNWLNGTLRDPIFPPHDLFGGWIRNP